MGILAVKPVGSTLREILESYQILNRGPATGRQAPTGGNNFKEFKGAYMPRQALMR